MGTSLEKPMGTMEVDPRVNVYIAMDNNFLMGKSIYFDWVIFNSYVKSPEDISWINKRTTISNSKSKGLHETYFIYHCLLNDETKYSLVGKL